VSEQEQLIRLFTRLPEEQRRQLMEFAQFLAERHGQDEAPTEVPEPTPIPRPENESVVGAIKRLSATYPMLDRSKMLHETSGLMAQHVLHGRDVVEVIDELEVLFQRHYDQQFRTC